MKKRILTAIICCFTSISFAQLVQGELKVKEQSKLELTVQSNKAVNLYADFRENKYPIQFAFTGNSIPINSDKKVVVQFVFTTIVKKDGKVVGTTKRNPIPFFPAICSCRSKRLILSRFFPIYKIIQRTIFLKFQKEIMKFYLKRNRLI